MRGECFGERVLEVNLRAARRKCVGGGCGSEVGAVDARGAGLCCGLISQKVLIKLL
jgi:hypothetical protein